MDPSSERCRSWLRSIGLNPDDTLSGNQIVADNTLAEYLLPPDSRCSAMMAACLMGELGFCEYLFENGAAQDVSTLSEFDPIPPPHSSDGAWSPMFGACENGGHLHIMKWLFKVGPAESVHFNHYPMGTMMHIAARKGRLDICEWLYAVSGDRADFYVSADNEDAYCQTPFTYACSTGHLEFVRWLINVQPDEAERRRLILGREQGAQVSETPMSKACFYGKLELVKYLFELEPHEIRFRDKNGLTPLHYCVASCYDHRSAECLMFLLLEAGCAPDITTSDHRGRTPVHIACLLGNKTYVQMMLLLVRRESHGEFSRNQDSNGDNIMQIALSSDSQAQSDQVFIDASQRGKLRSTRKIEGCLQLSTWFVREGYWCNDKGHIDEAVLVQRASSTTLHSFLCSELKAILETHSGFMGIFLAGMSRDSRPVELTQEDISAPKIKEERLVASSPLARIRGHDGPLRNIADYLDIWRGRELRHAREAVRILQALPAADENLRKSLLLE